MAGVAHLWGKDEDNPFGFTRESYAHNCGIVATILLPCRPLTQWVCLRLCLAERDIDEFIAVDTEFMRCEVWGFIMVMANNRCRGLLSLCISDVTKQMLLNNDGFLPHLIDGLMLDPEHPRKDTDAAIKTAVQRDFSECIQQIALLPAGCEALKANEAVMQALVTLKEKAWSKEAQACAEGALTALIPPEHHDIEALHIMLSCKVLPCRFHARVSGSLRH
jgi:hypothetical protein